MAEKFKLGEIRYEIELTDSPGKTVGNYKIEKKEDITYITISNSNVSGKEYLSVVNKISHHLLNVGDLNGKNLQNFEDELMDIWLFKKFGYTE